MVLSDQVFHRSRPNDLLMPKTRLTPELDFGNSAGIYSFVAEYRSIFDF
jgi:hypothetical protein